MIKNSIFIWGLMFVTSVSAQAHNLLNYGGFETGEPHATYYTVGQNIPLGNSSGWIVTHGSGAGPALVDNGWIGYSAVDGAKFLHLGDSRQPHGISQSFATEIDRMYELSLGAFALNGLGEGDLEISVGDFSTVVSIPEWAVAGGWTMLSYSFTATSTNSTLRIKQSVFGPALNIDAVSVEYRGPQVIITESEGFTKVQEESDSDSYQLVLSHTPSSNVTVTVNHDSQIEVTPSTLIFTLGNWDTPQTITITAVDDRLVEGLHSATIGHTASGDPDYAGISIADVAVSIADNDWAGDVNHDGRIDLGDLSDLADKWLDDCFPIDWCQGAGGGLGCQS